MKITDVGLGIVLYLIALLSLMLMYSAWTMVEAPEPKHYIVAFFSGIPLISWAIIEVLKRSSSKTITITTTIGLLLITAVILSINHKSKNNEQIPPKNGLYYDPNSDRGPILSLHWSTRQPGKVPS